MTDTMTVETITITVTEDGDKASILAAIEDLVEEEALNGLIEVITSGPIEVKAK